MGHRGTDRHKYASRDGQTSARHQQGAACSPLKRAQPVLCCCQRAGWRQQVVIGVAPGAYKGYRSSDEACKHYHSGSATDAVCWRAAQTDIGGGGRIQTSSELAMVSRMCRRLDNFA